MKPSTQVETLTVGDYVVTRTLERRKEERDANPHREIEDYVSVLLARMVGESKQLEQVLRGYPSRKKLSEKIAILDAHGYFDPGGKDWMYRAGPEGLTVQSWINAHDGRFGTLVVHVCNPGGSSVSSRKSLLLYPECSLGLRLQEELGRQINLYVPELGIVDPNDYSLERFINGGTPREAKSDRRSLLS